MPRNLLSTLLTAAAIMLVPTDPAAAAEVARRVGRYALAIGGDAEELGAALGISLLAGHLASRL